MNDLSLSPREANGVRSMTARNGHRFGESGPGTTVLWRCKFCSLRNYQLLQK